MEQWYVAGRCDRLITPSIHTRLQPTYLSCRVKRSHRQQCVQVRWDNLVHTSLVFCVTVSDPCDFVILILQICVYNAQRSSCSRSLRQFSGHFFQYSFLLRCLLVSRLNQIKTHTQVVPHRADRYRSSGFTAGFITGGVIFGTLGFLFAPQARRYSIMLDIVHSPLCRFPRGNLRPLLQLALSCKQLWSSSYNLDATPELRLSIAAFSKSDCRVNWQWMFPCGTEIRRWSSWQCSDLEMGKAILHKAELLKHGSVIMLWQWWSIVQSKFLLQLQVVALSAREMHALCVLTAMGASDL